MANTLVLLEKVTVGAAGASSVTFSNIPQTGYNDLVIKMSLRDDTNSGSYQQLSYRFNGSTANYSTRAVYADGATPGSGTTTTNTPTIGGTWGRLTSYGINQPNTTASTFTSFEWTIPNYTVSQYKSFSCDYVTENNGTTAYQEMIAGLWSDTSAINSIAITPYTGNFAQYSTLSLYGVSNVNTTPTKAPKATGGDIIQTDGTYWYHAFINSGTFTPATGLSCDILVVAGGGGGGFDNNGSSGGGGAGGLLGFNSQFVAASAQTITVGAGGAGSSSSSNGTNGVDSQFAALTLVKGGGGGSSRQNASSGGSGGGTGDGTNGTQWTPGSPTSGQGYAGGYAALTQQGAGGGGGATAAGGNATSNNGGAGGAGSSTYSSWGSATSTGQNVSGTYYYAGGGGGAAYYSSGTLGAGGNGGGGAGAKTSVTATTTGTPNTGGGGGGGGTAVGQTTGSQFYGAAGGSGIVIVRYTVA